MTFGGGGWLSREEGVVRDGGGMVKASRYSHAEKEEDQAWVWRH